MPNFDSRLNDLEALFAAGLLRRQEQSARDFGRLAPNEVAELADIMALLPRGVDPDATCDAWQLWRLSDAQLERLEALVLLVDAPASY